jgi:Lipid-binding putative hydrolase
MKYIKYILVLPLFALWSCDLVKEPAIGGTKVQAMAGEWWIRVLDDTGADIAGGYHLISTSNTAANTETDMILDDHQLWPAKVKVKVDIGALTFTPASNLDNLYSGTIKVSILEGKIIKGGAITPGKNKTDSTYFKLEFSDDPGTQYVYAGYRRTGFQEDEH